MPLRYTLAALFGLIMAALCYAMISHRREIEPIVRFLHPLLLGRRGGAYEPGLYIFYELIVGAFSAIPFVLAIVGFATKSRTDRMIDAYLANRLPRHEGKLPPDSK